MIFVTVGSELAFDRLVRTVDQWAQENGRSDVFAQIAETSWKPAHIAYQKFLEPAEFARRLTEASVIVSHAGMGTILSALRYEKPILVMPRRASLQEVRNEHQLATAKRLSEMGKVNVAFDEMELRQTLDKLGELKSISQISAFAGQDLTDALRAFIAKK